METSEFYFDASLDSLKIYYEFPIRMKEGTHQGKPKQMK